jgi:hypothetical protein
VNRRRKDAICIKFHNSCLEIRFTAAGVLLRPKDWKDSSLELHHFEPSSTTGMEDQNKTTDFAGLDSSGEVWTNPKRRWRESSTL